jgi:hypothetical protein
MHPVLTIRAGPRALQKIRAHGLDPALVEIIPGAAGGPKGLGIAGLDRAIFGEWLPSKPRVRHLIGGLDRGLALRGRVPARPGEGASRIRSASTRKPPIRPGPAAASCRSPHARCSRRFSRDAKDEVLASPWHRLHILTVRGRWPLTRDSSLHTSLGFGSRRSPTAIGRRHLARFIDRTVFLDARDRPPFMTVGDLSATGAGAPAALQCVSTPTASRSTARTWGRAPRSASIPMILEGVANIAARARGRLLGRRHHRLPPAPAYHHAEGIVLYPHFTDRIIPAGSTRACRGGARAASGWTTWWWWRRRTSTSRSCRTRKLPDRKDFARYAGNDAGRMVAWRKAIAESERLAEAFMEFTRTARPCAGVAALVVQDRREPALALREVHALAVRVVGDLVALDLADGEVARLRCEW